MDRWTLKHSEKDTKREIERKTNRDGVRNSSVLFDMQFFNFD